MAVTEGPVLWLDILSETSVAKALIGSWMYMRKVRYFHLPMCWIVLGLMPFRCIAMAPPACREWLLTLPSQYPSS